MYLFVLVTTPLHILHVHVYTCIDHVYTCTCIGHVYMFINCIEFTHIDIISLLYTYPRMELAYSFISSHPPLCDIFEVCWNYNILLWIPGTFRNLGNIIIIIIIWLYSAMCAKYRTKVHAPCLILTSLVAYMCFYTLDIN